MKKLIKRWLGINRLEQVLEDVSEDVYTYSLRLPTRDDISALTKSIDTVRERLKKIEAKVITRKFDLGDKVNDGSLDGVVVGFANQSSPYTYVVTYKDGYSEVFEESELKKQDDEQ